MTGLGSHTFLDAVWETSDDGARLDRGVALAGVLPLVVVIADHLERNSQSEVQMFEKDGRTGNGEGGGGGGGGLTQE